MNTWVKVARYQMVQRLNYVTLPWAALALIFVAQWAVIAMLGMHNTQLTGVVAIYAVFLIVGAGSVAQSLPFGLALGLSRRSYFLGTVLLAVALAAVDGLALAGLRGIERATGGWGLDMSFFGVAYILEGPWYLTWATSFVGLTLLFVYGLWWGLIYQRWNRIGVRVFVVAQVAVLLAIGLTADRFGSWPGIGQFFTDLTAPGLTGVLAVIAALLIVGGYVTMRRVRV
ncbi:MAG TPA: hypothetical protein VF344_08010 [Candidatus Limnocylindrales bacterium]